MKTQQLYTTKTRQALRNLVKAMKRQGLSVTSNERTKESGDKWACLVTQSVKPEHTTRKKKTSYTVVKGKAVCLPSKFSGYQVSL